MDRDRVGGVRTRIAEAAWLNGELCNPGPGKARQISEVGELENLEGTPCIASLGCLVFVVKDP